MVPNSLERFGIAPDILAALIRTVQAYPAIEQLLLYGSRARGRWRTGSDIDLAIVAPGLLDSDFNRLHDQIDGLPLIFPVSLFSIDKSQNQRLLANVAAEAVVLFERRQ